MDSKNQTNDLFLNEYENFNDLFNEMIKDLEIREKQLIERAKNCKDAVVYYKAVYKHIEYKNNRTDE